MAQSSAVSALPHRMASSFPDHPIPIPLRRSESVGPQKSAPPPQPAATPTDQPGLWLWTGAARQGAQESHRQPVYVLLTETEDEKEQKKSQMKSAPEFLAGWRTSSSQTEKGLGVVRECARYSGWRHLHVNDTAGHLTLSPASLPCECTIQMFRYQTGVYCRIARRSWWMGTLCDGWSVSRTQTKHVRVHVRVYTGSGHRNNSRPSTLNTFTISCRLEARL